MKHFIKIAGIALAIAFGTTTALAQDIRPYVGAGAGGFSLDAGVGSAYTAGGFGIIGAEFHENFAVELRAGATGNASVTATGVPTENTIDWFVSYLARLQLPMNDEVRIFALVGATTLKTTFSIPGFASLTNTSTSFSAGGGVEFKLQDQLHIGAEWVMYSNKADPFVTFPGLDASGISGTLRYSF